MLQIVAHYKALWKALAMAVNAGEHFGVLDIVSSMERAERTYSAKEKSQMEKELCQLASVLISKGALSVSS